MATHGQARLDTIRALENRKPFRRSGFAMQGIEGAATHTGRLDERRAARYRSDSEVEGIVYTVLSYATPIAWVKSTGDVVVVDQHFSVTTTHHQHLCMTYL